MATYSEALAKSTPQRPPDSASGHPEPSRTTRVLDALRQYGPALGAAALPAIIAATARGRPGAELVRRIAPQVFERLARSPRAYFFEAEPTTLSKYGPSTASIQPHLEEANPFKGRASWYTEINAPGNVPEAVFHEVGHASGIERGMEQRRIGPFKIPPGELVTPASLHWDILTAPKVRAILRREVEKMPSMLDYYVARRQGGSLAEALGELLTETWSNRILRRAGIQPRGPFFNLPHRREGISDKILPELREQHAPEIHAIRETGTVPGVAEALADYLAVLNAKHPLK